MSVDPWNVFSAHFGQMPAPSTALVTMLDLLAYLVFTVNVGRARSKYKIRAPATDGPDGFLRVFRVQQNTAEALIMHLPLLWIAAFAMDDIFAAALGAVWLFGRCLYARGYYDKAKRRTKGFLIGMVVNIVLFAATLASVLASL